MKKLSLKDFTNGWVVGAFSPTIVDTNAIEVAIKRYKAGDSEQAHYHAVATEITVIASGEVQMSGQTFVTDDIVVISPGESTDFVCIKDTVTTVIKFPCVKNDKFVI